jgi:hypothetical protein
MADEANSREARTRRAPHVACGQRDEAKASFHAGCVDRDAVISMLAAQPDTSEPEASRDDGLRADRWIDAITAEHNAAAKELAELKRERAEPT